MNGIQYRVEEIVSQLRDHGMRITPQRMAVLNVIVGNKEHLSTEDIYERVRTDYPMIGLATIYKTVTMLKEMGAISELNFSHHSARYDGSGAPPHPHFVCNQCNRIIDIEEDIPEDLSKNIAKKNGYHITNYRLDFFGICPKCQSEQTNPN